MKENIHIFMQAYSLEELLRDIICIDTQNPPGNEKLAVQYIEQFFKKLDANVQQQTLDHGDGRASLIVKIAGESKKALAFIGHTDTVPVGDSSLWKFPALDGIVENGCMYGRGTSDMKSGIVASLMTAEYFLKHKIKPSRDLYFIFTADEETGSIGIKSVCETDVLAQVSEVIIGEPTDNCIGIFEKGALGINVIARGKAAHAAQPNQGINAIELLYEYVLRLKNAMQSDRRSLFNDKVQVSITKISGGIKNNIIPDYAQVNLDVRTVDIEEHALIEAQLEQISKEMNKEMGINIAYEIRTNRLPLSVSEEANLLLGLKEIYADMNLPFTLVSIPYYTDMEEVKKHYDLPFAIVGPGIAKMAHQADEYVVLEDIKKMAEIYTNYALREVV